MASMKVTPLGMLQLRQGALSKHAQRTILFFFPREDKASEAQCRLAHVEMHPKNIIYLKTEWLLEQKECL